MLASISSLHLLSTFIGGNIIFNILVIYPLFICSHPEMSNIFIYKQVITFQNSSFFFSFLEVVSDYHFYTFIEVTLSYISSLHSCGGNIVFHRPAQRAYTNHIHICTYQQVITFFISFSFYHSQRLSLHYHFYTFIRGNIVLHILSSYARYRSLASRNK